jgi:GPH family glycoside/pentoside/hexuronide:cation symporter
MACYRIPYLSLGAELTSDYDERTRVIAIRSLLGLGGMLAGSALPFLLFFPEATGGADPKLRYEGYPQMGLFFGVVMALSGLVAVFGTLSRRTYAEPASGVAEARSFYSGMWLLLKNRQYRILWISFLLCSLSIVLNFTLAVPFYKWYARIPGSETIGTVQASFYAGAVAGVIAWIWVSRHGEKRNWLAMCILGLAGVLCSATVLIGDGHVLGTGNATALIVGSTIAGLLASALWVLPFSMMADVVDEDELENGVRREGICFGMMNFGEKLAAGGALLVSGVLLDVFVHLARGSEVQTPQAASRLGLVYGVLPGLILASSAAMIMTYRLSRSRIARIQEELRARRSLLASNTSRNNDPASGVDSQAG